MPLQVICKPVAGLKSSTVGIRPVDSAGERRALQAPVGAARPRKNINVPF